MEIHQTRVSAQELHLITQGRWRDILITCGAPAPSLDGKPGHPCPACGGTDRFHFTNRGGSGSYVCRGCGGGHDGFSLVGKILGLHPKEAFPKILEKVASIVGVNPERSGKPVRDEQNAGQHNTADVGEKARLLWQQAEWATDNHPYLRNKGVKPYGLKRYRGSLKIAGMACDGSLIVPLTDSSGTLSNLQWIGVDGQKRFLPGGKKLGLYYSFGPAHNVIILAEGYATAASIHEATGLLVVVAFDAGNLATVAQDFRERYPAANIVIAADDDWRTENNPGLSKASLAARDIGAWLALPDFGENRQEKHTDFNDIHQLFGLDVVLQQVRAAKKGSAIKPQPANETDALGQETVPWPLSDLGNAQRFVHEHGDTIRFNHPWKKWLYWNDTRWIIDRDGMVERLMKQTVQNLFDETKNAKDAREAYQLSRFAIKSQSRAGIENGLRLAQTEGGISITPEELDRDPWLLQADNGTLSLKSGMLVETDRKNHITKSTHVPFDPEATCPIWHQFLDRVTGGNQGLIDFLQRAAGYSLTGITREHVLFYLYGLGRNGKTKFLETLGKALGDYASRLPSESLMVKNNGSTTNNDIASLLGARIVISSEVRDGARLNESLVKEITGGDRLKARRLYEDFFEFDPTFKLWIAGNHKPIIHGTDEGVWRRIRLIPFTVTIPESEVDPKLGDKLEGELPGILNWMVDGCLLWQATGLKEPHEVKMATDEYKADSDILAQFLEDMCMVNPELRVSNQSIYKAFSNWCTNEGISIISNITLGRRLKDRGFVQVRNGKNRLWVGLSCVPGF